TGRNLALPPSGAPFSPSPCEARAGRAGERGSFCRTGAAFGDAPLPSPLPTPPSWGEGSDSAPGGSVKSRPAGPDTSSPCPAWNSVIKPVAMKLVASFAANTRNCGRGLGRQVLEKILKEQI